MEIFEVRLTVPCTVETAFDFLIQPANIKVISPPSMGLYFVEAPERLSEGARMRFKMQAFGVAREMVHEVTRFEHANQFVEEQISGPMRQWIHEHTFERTADGVTIIDRIRFEPPAGVVGLVITADRVLDNLEDGFDYRYEQIRKLLR